MGKVDLCGCCLGGTAGSPAGMLRAGGVQETSLVNSGGGVCIQTLFLSALQYGGSTGREW